MGLVSYSDSENSDTEEPSSSTTKAPTSSAPAAAKPSFQKLPTSSANNTTGPRRLRVDPPSVAPSQSSSAAQGAEPEQPPAKRARIGGGRGGAFSGFNALLPAPKRAAVSAPKAGVSLRTSGEAVFSRRPAGLEENAGLGGGHGSFGGDGSRTDETGKLESEAKAAVQEPKIVGNAMTFRPLSVASGKNKKKKVTAVKKPEEGLGTGSETQAKANGDLGGQKSTATQIEASEKQSAPKPAKLKKSLFSMHTAETEDEPTPATTATSRATYEPLTTSTPAQPTPEDFSSSSFPSQQQYQPTEPTLASTAEELNLTPSERRQLFGRKANNNNSATANNHGASNIKLTHFNTSAEYAANEAARQAGEMVEHRAVKTIAPGKHSLQQLVNNARSQQEGLEDKWAEGRREKGESGGRYGWSK